MKMVPEASFEGYLSEYLQLPCLSFLFCFGKIFEGVAFEMALLLVHVLLFWDVQ